MPIHIYKSTLMLGWALFSDEEPEALYRYQLGRYWKTRGRYINYVMLNPSTATERDNDPTVERCQRRATLLGYDGIIVTNLFAYRSTDPKNLKKVVDPVGEHNDVNILSAATESEIVICGWGTDGAILDRGKHVLSLLRRKHRQKLHALRMTQEGHPGHPLFLPYSLKPFRI